MMRNRLIVALVGLALASPALADEPTAREWLQRMTDAVHQLDYSGTFVYRHGSHIRTMRIFHSVDGEVENERLVALDGTQREVIRNGREVTCYLPDRNEAVVGYSGVGSHPFWLQRLTEPEPLEAVYQLRLGGTDRIAGQDAREIAVVPRDNLRYGQYIWVSLENGFPLRAKLVDEAGQSLEELVFTELTVHRRLPRHWLEPAISTEGFTIHRSSASPTDVPPEQRRWHAELPEGFILTRYQRQRHSGSKGEVEHLVFSDGLSSISIFADRALEGSEAAGLIRLGGVHAFERHHADHRVTVIGEVPARTVTMVAKSITWRESADD